jgi:hypothetical protein
MWRSLLRLVQSTALKKAHDGTMGAGIESIVLVSRTLG